MTLLFLVLLVGGALVGTLIARKQGNTARIEGLVGELISAEPNQLPEIVKELDRNPRLADTFLSPLLAVSGPSPKDKRSQLHARLALVARDKSLVEPLFEELLTNKVAYIGPIRRQLRPYAGELKERLWGILRFESAEAGRRFHAAQVLADYVPESEAASWSAQDLQFVARQLVSANPEFQSLLRENLRPISARLLSDLEAIFGDTKATEVQRLSAANAFADFAGSDIPKLSQLLAIATPEQYAVLYPIVAANPSPSIVVDLARIAATPPTTDLGSVERIPYGQRRANAAVTLLRLGEREKVLPVFEMNDDPEALTQFIFRCRERGVGVEALLDCLQLASDAEQDRFPRHSRYALLLALGEYKFQEIPESRREALLKQLGIWYRHDPSSGVHGATGWLLRQWGQAEEARPVDQTPVPYAPGREWFTLAIEVLAKSNSLLGGILGTSKKKTFYYTFIVFPAGEYEIGSVETETDRRKDEIRHSVKLSCPFALLDREITFEELIAFSPRYTRFMERYDAQVESAGFATDWFDSIGFCRWLGKQSGLPETDQAYAAPWLLDKVQYPHELNADGNWAPRDWPLDSGRPGFRLPTEAEWEVATRAGARTAYGYGSETSLLGRFGWSHENSGKQVHPPRQRRPNIRGMFDMHGNLFEWTHDWYGDFGETAVADPLGVKVGSMRVSRGGGWGAGEADCRAASRDLSAPTNRTNGSGFRLALSLSGK